MHPQLAAQIAEASEGGVLDLPALLAAVGAHYTALEQEARQSGERRVNALLQSLPDGMLTVTAEGVVLHASPAAGRLFHREAASLSGLSVAVLFGNGFSMGMLSATQRCECTLPAPTGQVAATVELFCGASPQGDVFVLSLRDITERKHMEVARNDYTEQLARSNAELERFAYAASHDLQEPLRTIGSFIQLLQQRHADQLSAEAREFMAFIAEGSAQMSDRVSGLLNLSRLQGSMLRAAPTELSLLLAASLEELQAGIAESGAEVQLNPLPRLSVDATQIRRVLINVIGNAIKFRHRARKPVIRIHARQERRHWRLAVTDNGIGIAAEHREKVFQIFQRLHTTEEYPGTGIGLALCQKIIHAHGGRIGVTEAETGGSEFWFTLPTE